MPGAACSSGNTERRDFLKTTVGAGAALVAARCAPAVPAAPSPAAAPAGEAWPAEWERLVEAARQEGKLSAVTLAGVGYRKAFDAFEKAFPGVTVELHTFTSSGLFAPKVLQERRAGVYSFDVAQTSVGTALRTLRPEGVWDPVRPLVFRPDVLADNLWQDGFEDGFITNDRALIYSFGLNVGKPFLVNTDLVDPAQIRSVRDLAEPRWKGRVLWADVRTGFTYFPLTAARFHLESGAEDLIRRLMVDQEPVFLRDNRQIAEAMTRGRYWLATGAPKAVMQEFRDQGLARALKEIDVPGTTYASGQSILYLNRAPHPNAAKLFINWLLTKEGQTAWCTNLELNSRRKDVPVVDPETVPAPGVRYILLDREQNFGKIEETQKMLLDMLGLKN